MARGYTSRMLAAGVSRHTVPEPPLPTEADFTARIFDQSWSLPGSPSSSEFSVLALDPVHAIEVGQRKLRRLHGAVAIAGMVCVKNEPRPWVDTESRLSALQIETLYDHEERQSRYAASKAVQA